MGQNETGYSDPVWHGWHNITNLEAQTLFSGSAAGPVTAVSRSTGRVDLFTVAGNGHVYTAGTWLPGDVPLMPAGPRLAMFTRGQTLM